MKTMHYDIGVPVNSYVDYCFVDEKGEIVWKNKNTACFAELFFGSAMTRSVKEVRIIRELSLFPYPRAAILAFVFDLNHMGFPMSCSMAKNGDGVDVVVIKFQVKDYDRKIHLKAAMTLTRCLWEVSICHVAGRYFQIIHDNPMVDRFDALQSAHKDSEWGLGGHAAISSLSANISREVFWGRVTKGQKSVFCQGYESYYEINNLFK